MKTRIDFYIITENALRGQWLFACRLLEKAYQQQHQINIYLNHDAEAHEFDDLLWTFRDISFIPHVLINTSNYPSPLQIGYKDQILHHHQDILLNLSDHIPDSFEKYERLIEIIPNMPELKQPARNRYKQYIDLGYEINTIDLLKK